MPAIISMLRQAYRRMVRAPTFSLTIIITLALGIGVTVAVFALVEAVLLRPLAYPEAERLVALHHAATRTELPLAGVSTGTLEHYRAYSRSFAAMSAYQERTYTVEDPGEPEQVRMAIISPSFFSVLRVTPLIGRFPTPATDDLDAREVVISYDMWVRRFGADADAIGRTVEIERERHVVVGVAPEGFHFPARETQLWRVWSASWLRRTGTQAALRGLVLNGIARLRPGVSIEDAETDLARLVGTLPDAFPDVTREDLREMGLRVDVVPLKEEVVGNARVPLLLLLAAAGFLLLITWANTANLCLVRAEQIRREVAVERALGAAVSHVVRRFVSEAALLVGPGAALGAALAVAAVRLRFGFSPEDIPRLARVGVNASVLGLATALAVASGALLVAVLLIGAYRPGPAGALTGAIARTTASRREQRGRRILVAAQVALALTLLIGSSLMARSYWRLKQVELGFRPEGALTFHLPIPPNAYGNYRASARLHARVLERVRAIPGVEAADAGTISAFPLTPVPGYYSQRIAVAGRAVADDATWPYALFGFATTGYFRTLGVPILRGRGFRPEDTSRETPGVVLSAALAQALFGDADPIGRKVRWARRSPFPDYTVVGVAGDVPSLSIREGPSNVMYFPNLYPPLADTVTGTIHVFIPSDEAYVVRTGLPPISLVPQVLRAIREVDPKLVATHVGTLGEVVAAATARARLTMWLLLVGAATALFLGVIGIYGVLAYAVRQRTREIGVRIAVGASPTNIIAMVVRQGAVLTLAGIVVGIASAWVLTRYLRSILYAVSPTDPLSFAAMAALLLGIALAASYLPARRAGRIDPVRALKME